MKRISKAHARGHFAKKFYGLQRKPFHPEECLKCGILPEDGKNNR